MNIKRSVLLASASAIGEINLLNSQGSQYCSLQLKTCDKSIFY